MNDKIKCGATFSVKINAFVFYSRFFSLSSFAAFEETMSKIKRKKKILCRIRNESKSRNLFHSFDHSIVRALDRGSTHTHMHIRSHFDQKLHKIVLIFTRALHNQFVCQMMFNSACRPNTIFKSFLYYFSSLFRAYKCRWAIQTELKDKKKRSKIFL